LEKEGDSGRLRIKELENEIDSYERRLLQWVSPSPPLHVSV
jgi:hypothetical protein